MVKLIDSSGVSSENTDELISVFGVITKYLKQEEYPDIFHRFEEEFANRVNELSNE
jgi:hypothetical protein